MTDREKQIEEFIYDGDFIDPAKYQAVRIYGLEKAKEMWKDGEPNFNIIQNLNLIGCQRYLSGEWKKDNFLNS